MATSFALPNFSNTNYGGISPGNTMMSAGEFSFNPNAPNPFLYGTGGQNQYMNYPSMSYQGFPQMPGSASPMATSYNYPPGIVPPSQGFDPSVPGYPTSNTSGTAGAVGTSTKLPGGAYGGPTTDPLFTQAWAQYLASQMGQGVTPFDLSAILPSTGQATAPGTLTAPENPLLQSLQQFYQTGTGGPLPGVLPMWTSEMQAMQIPIQQQQANIEEAFGSRGALGSSESAQALATFGEQTAAQEQSLLGQLTLQALPGMEQSAMDIQGLDQQAINNLYQEFIRTQPQYNPMLGYESGFATTYPPIYGKQGFGASLGQTLGSTLGGGLGGAAMGGLSGLLSMIPF